MTIENSWIQLAGLCSTLLFFSSYQCRSNRRLFQVQFAPYLSYMAHLLLLGAVTGGVSYMINTVRSLCLGGKWKFGRSRAMCALPCLAQAAALALTWGGWLSILPVAANIALTIAGYSGNPRRIRLAGMLVNSPLWIVYSAASGSQAGILDEAVTEISMIVSIIRFGWKALDRVED